MSKPSLKALNTVRRQIESGLGSQKDKTYLNAFISAAGSKAGFELEVQESVDRYDNDCRKSSLDGTLIGIKDNICTQDEPTTCASAVLDQYRSPFSATVIEQLKDAGAFVMGKTNLDEFGMGSHSINSHFGPVHNQSNRNGKTLSAGGSSGGSAVAVSTGQRITALATDTGGSVRLPAAYTGIYGFKPSYGKLSRWGVVPYANSLDTVGIMARNERVIEQVYQKLSSEHLTSTSGYGIPAGRSNVRDPTLIKSRTLAKRPVDMGGSCETGRTGNYRIGVPMEYNTKELDPIIRGIWLESLQALDHHGHSIHLVSLPTTPIALSAYYIIAAAEASSNLAKYDGVRYGNPAEHGPSGLNSVAETRGSRLGEEVKRRILLGSYTLSAGAINNHFIKAQKVRRLVQRDFDKVFRKSNPLSKNQNSIPNKEGVDFILTPTTPTLPPTLEALSSKRPVDAFADDVLTVPASLAGLPAISVPINISGHQTPPTSEFNHVGVQLIGQYGSDMAVIQASVQLRRAVAYYRSLNETSTPKDAKVE